MTSTTDPTTATGATQATEANRAHGETVATPLAQAAEGSEAASTLLLGAVAYDPKVVTIWNGFRDWFQRQAFPFDYVLYSHYEHQVTDLIAGRIHVAWNSPLAWVRARRLGRASGAEVTALAMRDTDRDLTSVIAVRADSPIRSLADLRGKTLAVGAVDSPQATLLPLAYIRAAGLLPGADFTLRRFDVGVGLHGDHVGGEREAAHSLVAGQVDAACMIDGNHLAFMRDGTLPSGSTRILAQTAPFDHCNMTVSPSAPRELAEGFKALLLGMSYADPALRPLLDLEGLKAWCDGRTSGYAPLEGAVDALGFYDAAGNVTAPDYRP
jgi:ABC-type phosphate/phosphonate transport system substrate-binding protein